MSGHALPVKFYLDWTAFGRRIPLWREGAPFNESISFGGIWASAIQRGLPFSWSFEYQFSSSSRTFSKTIGKWVSLMWVVGAVITDKTTKLKNRILAYRCGLLLHNCNNSKMGPCVTISGIKEKIFDSSTLVYISLDSSSDSSTLV